MRLTLRTLLAYRDRVLNPAELEDMHRRVQQSAMASNLIKRIDSLSQRTNILAPPIDGTGLGADANSIAEYLDDSLKGDKVPELERICLESDVQLAELTQCHSLLSAALSTPVDVPGTLRQRIIAMADASQRAALLERKRDDVRNRLESLPAAEHDGRDEDHSSGSQRSLESADGKKRLRTDDTHAAQADSTNGQARSKDRALVPAQAVAAPMVASGGDSIRPSGLDLEGSHLAHEVPEYLRGRSRDGWLGPVAIGGLLCLLALLVWQSIGSWSSVQEMFAHNPSQPVETEPAKATPLAPTTENENPRPENNSAPKSSVPSKEPSAQTGLPSIPSIAKSSESDATSADQPQPVEPQPALAEMNQVARWLPTDAIASQALVLVQAGAQALHRLQPSESIPSGSQLFVPSANRPKLDIVGGPQWQVCGTTHAILIKPDTGAESVSQIDLRLGRAIVTSSASGDSVSLATPAGSLRLKVGGSASAAVELSYVPRAHGPVNNRSAYVPTLSIYAMEGEPTLEWNNQQIKLTANTQRLLQGNQLSEPQAMEAPLWVDSSFDRPVDLLAAADISKQLSDNSGLGESLQKLATNRRPETRALAAQTLALLGSWEWITQPKSSLADARDRSYWAALLDRTRQILAAHPENVEALSASLEQLDRASAPWRLQLWLGLDATQLQGDGSQKLLASLDHEALIERILAIQQLQRATGKDLGYQAAEPSRTIITQWTRDLGSGKVTILPTPKS